MAKSCEREEGEHGRLADGERKKTYTHEQDDVTTIVEGVEDLRRNASQHNRRKKENDETHLISRSLLELLLQQDQSRRRERHEDTVSDITEHDREQERERDDGEQSRVDLLV
jgi:hypothetical protein